MLCEKYAHYRTSLRLPEMQFAGMGNISNVVQFCVLMFFLLYFTALLNGVYTRCPIFDTDHDTPVAVVAAFNAFFGGGHQRSRRHPVNLVNHPIIQV